MIEEKFLKQVLVSCVRDGGYVVAYISNLEQLSKYRNAFEELDDLLVMDPNPFRQS